MGYDHVKVPPAWAAKLPPRGAWELELLRNYWDDDDITSVSRLGSQLPLTKELDGIESAHPRRHSPRRGTWERLAYV